MTIKEFREIAEEVFEVVKDSSGNSKYKGFPTGCDECTSEIEWDCYHKEEDGSEYICSWRENHWKYDELRNIIMLEELRKSGFDLNRIDSLTFDDFLKITVLTTYMREK